MGQILGMLSLNFFADRFGRKKALYLLWIVLVAVRSRFPISLLTEPRLTPAFPLIHRVSSLRHSLQRGGPG